MERQWTVQAYVDDAGQVDLDASEVAQAALDAATIVGRLGGVAFIGADRQEVSPDVFITRALVFRWNSYAPGRRAPKPEAVPEPEPDPEPNPGLEPAAA